MESIGEFYYRRSVNILAKNVEISFFQLLEIKFGFYCPQVGSESFGWKILLLFLC